MTDERPEPAGRISDGWYCIGDVYPFHAGERGNSVGGFTAGPFADMATAQAALQRGGRSTDDLAAALARAEARVRELEDREQRRQRLVSVVATSDGDRTTQVSDLIDLANSLEARIQAYQSGVRSLTERVVTLEARERALIAAGDGLRQYSGHLSSCAFMVTLGEGPCTCDCEAARAAWDAAKGKEGQDG